VAGIKHPKEQEPFMDMAAWLAAIGGKLEQSSFGDWVRVTPYLYPVLESLHILGIAMLVGSALAVDLRLLGVGRAVLPVTIVAHYLLPLSHLGFAVVVLTGGVMFTAIAASVTTSAAAAWKFGLIAVAGLNIAVFHTGVYRSVGAWDLGSRTPLLAQVAALVSGLSWTGVIVAGRFLAY
jgi:hypothetical protein